MVELEHLKSQLKEQEEAIGRILTLLQEQNAAITKITLVLDSHFKEMVAALSGKEHMPMPVAIFLTKTFAFALIGLVFALIFVLTGIKFDFLPLLHGKEM